MPQTSMTKPVYSVAGMSGAGAERDHPQPDHCDWRRPGQPRGLAVPQPGLDHSRRPPRHAPGLTPRLRHLEILHARMGNMAGANFVKEVSG